MEGKHLCHHSAATEMKAQWYQPTAAIRAGMETQVSQSLLYYRFLLWRPRQNSLFFLEPTYYLNIFKQALMSNLGKEGRGKETIRLQTVGPRHGTGETAGAAAPGRERTLISARGPELSMAWERKEKAMPPAAGPSSRLKNTLALSLNFLPYVCICWAVFWNVQHHEIKWR